LILISFNATFNPMKELSEDRIKELARLKLEGKSYAEIRADLAGEGMNPEKISQVIRQVDEIVLQAETEFKHTAKARQWHKVGLVLAVTGLLISIAYNAGFVLTGFPPWLVYSPFFAGILLMFYGRMQQRKQPELNRKGSGRIRRKRPYK
jgi:hypothetical protein